jgi:hypothetical protein
MCGAQVERMRSTRRYCAVACRMRAYRLRRNGPPRRRLPLPAKAHQRVVRERHAGDGVEESDIGTTTVRPIP